LTAKEKFVKKFLEKHVLENSAFQGFLGSTRDSSVFTSEPFDFYGSYVRINEQQKYKFAETKTILEY